LTAAAYSFALAFASIKPLTACCSCKLYFTTLTIPSLILTSTCLLTSAYRLVRKRLGLPFVTKLILLLIELKIFIFCFSEPVLFNLCLSGWSGKGIYIVQVKDRTGIIIETRKIVIQ
jgi:hypothetical protein